MSDDKKTRKFRYYFAIDKGDYRAFEDMLSNQAVLVSFERLRSAVDKRGSAREMFKVHPGPLMIDSGGFTNFTKPGSVQFDEWLEYIKAAADEGWVDEYVQFDDLGSRPETMRLFKVATEAALDPLFVDHLWFGTHDDEVLRIWKDRNKVCMSGFAKTLPGQRTFPGDPGAKLASRFEKGRELDTVNHLLAVGSMRRFMADIDRVDSVDSAAWDKAVAFGKILTLGTAEIAGVEVPVLRGYDRPDSYSPRRPMPPDVKKAEWDRVISENEKEWKGVGASLSPANLAKRVTLHHVIKYAEALQTFDPTELRAARNMAKLEKAAGTGQGFWFFDDVYERAEIPGDGRVPDYTDAGLEAVEAAIHDGLASFARPPLPMHIDVLKSSSERELLRVEKAAEGRKPWLTYYFACSQGDMAKFFAEGDSDVLISFAHMVPKTKGKDARVPWETLKRIKDHGRKLMLDSGAFTNFNKPGTVSIEQYVEFLSDSRVRELFDEYVTFDELRDRAQTVRNHINLLEKGLTPMFVDHLWHDDAGVVKDIWKYDDKLCLSGFATTLPTQERFPGDPKARLHEAMLLGREVETQTHLLAVSSMRRFLKYADRVDSVDSTAWAKAGVYGMFLHTEYDERNGVTAPFQKVYDQPTSRRKQPRYAPKEEQRKVTARVRQLRKEHGCSERQAYIRYSIEQARAYVAALNALEPTKVAEAYAAKKTEKGLDGDDELLARGTGMVWLTKDWGARDETVSEQTSSFAVEKAEDGIDPEQIAMLDPRSYRPDARENEQLRSDWGVVVALWTSHRTHGEGAQAAYTKAELVQLGEMILTEVNRRGPEAMTFAPEEMGDHERELYGAVVRTVDPSPDVVSKEVVTHKTDFESASAELLLGYHDDLHTIAMRIGSTPDPADWSWPELSDTHGRLVEAMEKAGIYHPEKRDVLDRAAAPFTRRTKAATFIPRGEDARLFEVTPENAEELEARLRKINKAYETLNRDGSGRVARKSGVISGRTDATLLDVKVEEVIATFGPPGSWDGAVAVLLGPQWRERAYTYWDGLSEKARRKIENAHYLLWEREDLERTEGEIVDVLAALDNPSTPALDRIRLEAKLINLEQRLHWLKRENDSRKSSKAAPSAVSKAEEQKAEARYERIDFSVPASVRAELKRGLKWHEEGHSGDGLQSETVSWATKLAGGDPISPDKARKMKAWLARHEADKAGKGFEPGEDGFPSPGRVAWALWGGDPAVGWSAKLVRQMDAADRGVSKSTITSSVGGKLRPARYVTHLHVAANKPTLTLRVEKSSGSSLETWAWDRPALTKTLGSLAEVTELVESGNLLLSGDPEPVRKLADGPNGWLQIEGLVPPGHAWATSTHPGIFAVVETGTATVLKGANGERIVRCTPDNDGEVRVLTMRKLPCAAESLGTPEIKSLVDKQFDDVDLPDLVAKIAGRTGTAETWVSKLTLAERTAMSEGERTNVTKCESGEIFPDEVRVLKAAEKRIVTGVVLQPGVVDAHNDIITAEEIEQAAYRYLSRFNKETEVGLMHKVFGDVGLELVESWVAPVEMTINGFKVLKGTWMMTMRVIDDELWKLVKDGKLTGFSIGGVATPVPV